MKKLAILLSLASLVAGNEPIIHFTDEGWAERHLEGLKSYLKPHKTTTHHHTLSTQTGVPLDPQLPPSPKTYSPRGKYGVGPLPPVRRSNGAGPIYDIVGPEAPPYHSKAYNKSMKYICQPQIYVSLTDGVAATFQPWVNAECRTCVFRQILAMVVEQEDMFEWANKHMCVITLIYSPVLPEHVARKQLRPLDPFLKRYSDATGIDPVMDMPAQSRYHMLIEGKYWGIPMVLQMLTMRANATTYYKHKRWVPPPSNTNLLGLNKSWTKWSRSAKEAQQTGNPVWDFERVVDDVNFFFWQKRYKEPFVYDICMLTPLIMSVMMSRGVYLFDENGNFGPEQEKFWKSQDGHRTVADLLYELGEGKHENMARWFGLHSEATRKYVAKRLAGGHWTPDDPYLMYVGTCEVGSQVDALSCLYRAKPGTIPDPQVVSVQSQDRIVQMNGWYFGIPSRINESDALLMEKFLAFHMNYKDNPSRATIDIGRGSIPIYKNGRDDPQIVSWMKTQGLTNSMRWFPKANHVGQDAYNQYLLLKQFEFNDNEVSKARPPAYPSEAHSGDNYLELYNIIPIYLMELWWFQGLQNLQGFDLLNWQRVPYDQIKNDLPSYRFNLTAVRVPLSREEKEKRFLAAAKEAGKVAKYIRLPLCSPGRDLDFCTSPEAFLVAEKDPGSMEAQILSKDCQRESDLLWITNSTCDLEGGRKAVQYPVYDPSKVGVTCRVSSWSLKMVIEKVKWRVGNCQKMCTPGGDLDSCSTSSPHEDCQKETDLLWTKEETCSVQEGRKARLVPGWDPAKLGVTCRLSPWSTFALTNLVTERRVSCTSVCTPGQHLDVCSAPDSASLAEQDPGSLLEDLLNNDCKLVGDIRWVLNSSCTEVGALSTTRYPVWDERKVGITCELSAWSQRALREGVKRVTVPCPSACSLGREWNGSSCEIRLLRRDDSLKVSFGSESEQAIPLVALLVAFVVSVVSMWVTERATREHYSYHKKQKLGSTFWRKYWNWMFLRGTGLWLYTWFICLILSTDVQLTSVAGEEAVKGQLQGEVNSVALVVSLLLSFLLVMPSQTALLDTLNLDLVRTHLRQIEYSKLAQHDGSPTHSPGSGSRSLSGPAGLSSIHLNAVPSPKSGSLNTNEQEEEPRKEKKPLLPLYFLRMSTKYYPLAVALMSASIPVTLGLVWKLNELSQPTRATLNFGLGLVSFLINFLTILVAEWILLLTTGIPRYVAAGLTPIILTLSARLCLEEAIFVHQGSHESNLGSMRYSHLSTSFGVVMIILVLISLWILHETGDVSFFASKAKIRKLKADKKKLYTRITGLEELATRRLVLMARFMISTGTPLTPDQDKEIWELLNLVYLRKYAKEQRVVGNAKEEYDRLSRIPPTKLVEKTLSRPHHFVSLIEHANETHINELTSFLAFYSLIYSRIKDPLLISRAIVFVKDIWLKDKAPREINVGAMRDKPVKKIEEGKVEKGMLDDIFKEVMRLTGGNIPTSGSLQQRFAASNFILGEVTAETKGTVHEYLLETEAEPWIRNLPDAPGNEEDEDEEGPITSKASPRNESKSAASKYSKVDPETADVQTRALASLMKQEASRANSAKPDAAVPTKPETKEPNPPGCLEDHE